MMDSATVKIRLRNVGHRFRIARDRARTLREAFTRRFRPGAHVRDLEALKDVSLSVRPGESVGIIGRNGSGKSTLLRLIVRIYRPTTGAVEVHGSVSPLIELGAGFHPELTGRENVILAGALMGINPSEMRRRVEAVLAFAELTEFGEALVKQYSSGMFARLAFAVAVETDPDILLVDEILAVGDEPFQQKCLERMHHFRRQGKTLLFVSHDLAAIRSLCDRVVLLHQGQILADGLPEPVIGRYHELLQEPRAAGGRPS
jgi:ABC-type polysaccharide/polyol phosphate transport system ATPase subunit